MADGKDYNHIIAIDFGTAGCGIAIKIANETIGKEIHVFQQWLPRKNSIKCPTIILLNQNLDFVAFGSPARKIYYTKLKKKPDEAKLCYLFEYFKMSLYTGKVAICIVCHTHD